MVELGRIEKPDAKSFSKKRKLYYVPNIYPFKDTDAEYTKLVDKYWEDVVQQIEKLEAAGKIKKIFCENIYTDTKDALEELERINKKAHVIVKKKIEAGATILPIESKEISEPYIDWRNCLAVVRTREVSTKVFEFYKELYDKRLQHIQNVIENNLAEGEAALLIMADEERVKLQLPQDIELFLIMPPSYDDLLKWFREKLKNLTS